MRSLPKTKSELQNRKYAQKPGPCCPLGLAPFERSFTPRRRAGRGGVEKQGRASVVPARSRYTVGCGRVAIGDVAIGRGLDQIGIDARRIGGRAYEGTVYLPIASGTQGKRFLLWLARVACGAPRFVLPIAIVLISVGSLPIGERVNGLLAAKVRRNIFPWTFAYRGTGANRPPF